MFSIWCVLSSFERHCEVVWERDFSWGGGEIDCPRDWGLVSHAMVYMVYWDDIVLISVSLLVMGDGGRVLVSLFL